MLVSTAGAAESAGHTHAGAVCPNRRSPIATIVFLAIGVSVALAAAAGLFGRWEPTALFCLGLATLAALVASVWVRRPSRIWPWAAIATALALFLAAGVERSALHTMGDLTSSRSLLPDLLALPGYVLLAAGLLATQISCAPKSPAAGRKVTLPNGTFTIDTVEFGDRTPPGCQPGPSCVQLQPGFQAVLIWLKVEGDAEGAELALISNMKDATLQSDDGTQTYASMVGDSTRFGAAGETKSVRPYLAFAPPQGSRNFVLHWGNNPPIRLSK